MNIELKTFFDKETATFTHIITDKETKHSAIIDSVLNYDLYSGRTKTDSADLVIAYVKEHGLIIDWILETHVHADHITAAHYLKTQLGGRIGIGSKITEVLKHWVPIFNTGNDTPLDGSQFDHLFEDGETFWIGKTSVQVIHTPGHTPACATYVIGDMAFVGDTLFMPDVGTARTDFPGGDAGVLYDSIKKILSLPAETILLLCHDYPTAGRQEVFQISVAEERKKNILIHDGITRDEYIQIRNGRDFNKPVPKLLLPSLQANLRAGTFGNPEDNNVSYIKIPINCI